MRIGLVFGGHTTEGEVSIHSAEGIRGALKALNYEVVDIEFSKNIAMSIMDANVDLIFNAMHGQYGEDGCLQGLLDIMQIPYTHSGRLASAIAMNKDLSKKIFNDIGIKTAKSILVSKENLQNGSWKEKIKNDNYLSTKKEFFVKPVCDGSSRDTFLVKNIDEYSFQEQSFQSACNDFLIEERIKGREIQVAVLGTGKEAFAIGMLEVKPQGDFYDYEAKYSVNGAIHTAVDNIDEATRKELLESAVEIHNIIGLKDVSRSEFLLTKENEIYALEVNSHPGFTSTSIVPEIARNAGISYEQVVDLLVKNAKFG